MVASGCRSRSGEGSLAWFQSPSLRGSGRFDMDQVLASIEDGFNPLHCGAVVASTRRPLGPPVRYPGFNPLHCGAVVASTFANREHLYSLLVSIPFIAGQWSLPASTTPIVAVRNLFQSPSLRGSGRFLHTVHTTISANNKFQSPSLRGSGRFGYT